MFDGPNKSVVIFLKRQDETVHCVGMFERLGYAVSIAFNYLDVRKFVVERQPRFLLTDDYEAHELTLVDTVDEKTSLLFVVNSSQASRPNVFENTGATAVFVRGENADDPPITKVVVNPDA